jgi:hypothetical protein
MPSLPNTRRVCSRRPKAGQLEVASWLFWALLSAIFAAVTAIFAKIGVANINSDLATLFRTVVIAVVLAAILALTKQYQPLASISTRTYAFLALSGFLALLFSRLEARRGFPRRAGRQTFDCSRCCLRCRIFGRAAHGGELVWHRPDRLRRAARRLQGLSAPGIDLEHAH